MFDVFTTLSAGSTMLLFILLIAFNFWLFRRNRRELQQHKRRGL
ncbi:hypothetical protein [Leptolyngbya sp. FACHB-261]|nr:hypothetical protein [Leptolyngbya sp. FACHB-261]